MSAKAAPKKAEESTENPDDIRGLAPEDAVATAYNQLRACDSEQRLWIITLTKCLDTISSNCDADPSGAEASRARACCSAYDRISRICNSDQQSAKNDIFGA